MKFLIITTSVSRYDNGVETGLWLSELTHIYDKAKACSCEITIASIDGGVVPVDPESLKPFVLDAVSKKLWEDDSFRNELQHTKSLSDISDQEYDLVYLTGGHGTMYDFPENVTLQAIIQTHYGRHKKIAAICHGVGGLVNVKLDTGKYLISGKKLTGFDWFEEFLVRRRDEVPFNLEAVLKERGAIYNKACVPMTSNVVVDGGLITGQNPFSSKKMALVVMRELGVTLS